MKNIKEILNKTVKLDNNNIIIGTIKKITNNKLKIKPLKGKSFFISYNEKILKNIKIYPDTTKGHKDFCKDANNLIKHNNKIKREI